MSRRVAGIVSLEGERQFIESSRVSSTLMDLMRSRNNVFLFNE